MYDYQKEMLRQIEEAFRKHQSVMVQMPTGTGKTVLLAEEVKSEERRVKNADGVKSEERRVKNPCVWIVVHRRELVEQIEKTLAKQLDSSLFVLPSSLTPLPSSLTPLPSSLPPRVFSIQWLSKHYHKLEEKPSLIIIDEAHHAVAKTYKEVMDAYPEARKLGLTATPCRLNRRGFTDLFDVLLQSWSVKKFIADGWLSLYDYMSIREDSDDWRVVSSLKKRGADGDFSLNEMSEKLNVLPSIERLCDTILRYAPDKKGITYAIDIAHAERIAQYYREHGLNAVAISSKTPPEERKQLIEWFRNTNCHESPEDSNTNYHEIERDSNTNYHELPTNLSTNCHELERDLNTNCHELSSNCRQFKIQKFKIGFADNSKLKILITVDLFGEGFDCPDVEFIQLARPTLSLSKYLQQVGRGMRVFDGKKYCLILDNVGLYRLFGLPSDDRDWQAMFEGSMAGKGSLSREKVMYDVAYSIRDEKKAVTSDARTELITVMTHEGQRIDLDAEYGYRVVDNGEGLHGVVDKKGKEVLPCQYSKIELKAYGIARLHSRRKIDRERPWMDLRNGIRFYKQPRIERYGRMEFATTDGLRLYPRVRTRLMDDSCFVLSKALEHGIGDGLRFRNFFVQPSEPDLLYRLKEKIDDLTIWEDEQGRLAWRQDWDSMLYPTTTEEVQQKRRAWEEDVRMMEEEKKLYVRFFQPEIETDYIDGKTRLADYKEPANLRITNVAKGNYQVSYRKHWLDKWESLGSYAKIYPQAYGIRVVQNREGKYLVRTELFKPFESPEPTYEFAELQDNALLHFKEQDADYWVCLENRLCFTRKPEIVDIGFMSFLRVGSLYVRCGRGDWEVYRRAEIRMRGDICFLGTKDVYVRSAISPQHYYIQQRHLDGKRFVLSNTRNPDESSVLYDMYYDGKNPPVVERRMRRTV